MAYDFKYRIDIDQPDYNATRNNSYVEDTGIYPIDLEGYLRKLYEILDNMQMLVDKHSLFKSDSCCKKDNLNPSKAADKHEKMPNVYTCLSVISTSQLSRINISSQFCAYMRCAEMKLYKLYLFRICRMHAINLEFTKIRLLKKREHEKKVLKDILGYIYQIKMSMYG